MAKLIPKIFCQNLAVSRQKSSFVRRYFDSAIAITKPIPSVSGTKSQWYIAVMANMIRDQSTSELSNIR